uniref:DEP domain-containing protein 5 n=1 Tax=Aceria tosichella TaxID=561515 RepID=A0A6G1S832_9ACAR
MPTLRLRKHQAHFSDEDILINQADFPGLKLNDVVELRPHKLGAANTTNQNTNQSNAANRNNDRILLQVRKWPENNQSYPNTVSIKDSVLSPQLKLYSDVQVNVVDKKEVVVDSIEICFSNAYLARSYMWGLRNHLNNRCVYQRQKLDYLHIRSQICEIWAHGNKVSSGYVDDDTKIVFRSASSLVYLFIQMSSEMWDYDINGDLYCEKAINGFLTDLFETWRQNDCSHDITIVLFSRTFYDAESLDEFPEEMRECLQVDYRGIFYEDCYRVAFQNDRFDLHDWNAKLTALKSWFNQYQKEVINRHQEKYETKIPRAYNSSAAQGNFLEVLNMSLNVFEKHYFDRSFDRTGQLSVVVSPGVGVFEVDFELTNLTKQRIIDNGIGSDLVCLGEQPLHTVPLLKFNSKSSQLDDNLACDVYNMPHWINLSFYSSQNQVYYSNFVPRIKLPTLSSNKLKSDSSKATVIANTDQPGGQGGGSAVSSGRPRTDSNTMAADEQAGKMNHLRQPSAQQHQNKIGASRRDRINNEPGPQMSSSTIPDLVDYDDYDAQVFKSSPMASYQPAGRGSGGGTGGGSSGGGGGGSGTGANGVNAGCGAGERSILADMDPNVDYLSDGDEDDDFLDRDNRNKSASIQRRSSDVKNYQEYSRNMKRQATENLPISQARNHQASNHHQVQSTFTRMSLVDSYLSDVKIKPESADDLSVRGYNVQSSRLSRSCARPKALINPFDPSHMTIKLTPNRRRWTHVFPQGPTGTFIQQHHYQPMPQKSALPYLADVSPPAMIPENEPLAKRGPPVTTSNSSGLINWSSSSTVSTLKRDAPMRPSHHSHHHYNDNVSMARLSMAAADHQYYNKPSLAGGNKLSLTLQANNNQSTTNKSTLVSNDTIRFAWCASGEQEWTPAITTGVDWKSLTMPACLPLTTDFFSKQD